METITAYKCEHCYDEVFEDKMMGHRHEENCFLNPKIRGCGTCNYHEYYDVGIHHCTRGHDLEIEFKQDCKDYEIDR
jgi:hypothetical protein